MIGYIITLLVLVKFKTTDTMITCNGVVFRKEYYDKHVLFDGLGKPNNLVMHTPTGYLFFSHTIQNGSEIDFGIMACHVARKKCKDITGVAGGYAVAWDRGNNLVFLGGHDGIYIYNFLTNSVKYFAEKGKSIWSLFARRNFYYIRYPTQTLYVYKNGTFLPVPEAENIEIDNFFVSQRFSIFYSNKTGLFKVNRPSEKPVMLKKDINVKQITYDLHGDIYFSTSDGIYMNDRRKRKVTKVANIDDMYGMVFHKAGKRDRRSKKKQFELIYSNKDTIYILLPSENGRICMNKTRSINFVTNEII